MMKRRVIAVEEHFTTAGFRDIFRSPYHSKSPRWESKLEDMGDQRIQEMDEAGVDIQILSQTQPGSQALGADDAIRLARSANDFLHDTITMHPTRFAGFAELPTSDPEAAANELERAVTSYSFKGGLINGLANQEFLDLPKYRCIFRKANELRVPIYLHPAIPHSAVIEAWLKDYPDMIGAGWGFTAETATQIIRMIMSGIFDELPNLKIVVGHFGETLPFVLWRCDRVLSRNSKLKHRFRYYFENNFYISTSSNYSVPALLCSGMEVGFDQILFAVDWPMHNNIEAVQFIENAPISATDKQKIFSLNAEKLFGL